MKKRNHDNARCFLSENRICPIFSDDEQEAPSCPLMLYHQETGYWTCGIAVIPAMIGHQNRAVLSCLARKKIESKGKKSYVTRMIRWKD